MTVQQSPSVRTHPRPAIWQRAGFWEAAVWLALCVGWIWAMALGDSNGFGYFHQPQNDLVAPLIVGGVVNAATFWAHAFHAVPRYLATGRWRAYLAALVVLFAANVALQAASQKLIILMSEPGLKGLSWSELLIENSYMPPLLLMFSALYKFARDWLIHLRERRALLARAHALEQALEQSRAEIHVLNSAGAPRTFLQIAAGREKLQIPVDAIQYVKSAGNYLDIVTPERSYLAYGALKDILRNLPPDRFARIHRSYLVGLDHIRMIRGDAVCLNGTELPIGAVYKRAFLQGWERRTTSRG